MSQRLGKILSNLDTKKKLTRDQMLAHQPVKIYDDGKTKQCFAPECDINSIMARFAKTDTITHLNKHQGQYGDFSDFDFHEQTRMLTRGREIFDDLDAEIRREFGQSPEAFFKAINTPGVDQEELLLRLAKPGNQLPAVSAPDADQAAVAAASELASENPNSTPAATSAVTPADAKDG